MFKSGCGDLQLRGDHLDLSYRNPELWPNLTPGGSIRSFTFYVGDSIAGPAVQLGLNTPVETEVLDWKHSIDPVHHHGSDQFRVVSAGKWILAGRTMVAGGYAFQEAGWVYQEHPGHGAEPTWLALIMADRRGTAATLRFARDRETIFASDMKDGGGIVEPEIYPHPAGDKGIAAIATSHGPCDWGYRLGDIKDLARDGSAGALTGLLGDERVGPVIHVLNSGAKTVAIPACTYPTELFLVFVTGSCRIGAQSYRAGDLRLQNAYAPLEDVISGDEGVGITVVVADRRAWPVLNGSTTAPSWMFETESVSRRLSPAPGGVRRQ